MSDVVNWRVWAFVILLVLLLHAMVLMQHFQWYPLTSPPPVEVQQIDPKKLDAIRKQWAERSKSLLLDKKNLPTAKEAPPDARYMSERNIRVEKEQRARQTNVIPKSGLPGPEARTEKAHPAEPKVPRVHPKALPNLGDLGIPMKLSPAIPKLDQFNQNHNAPIAPHSGQDAGDQALNERQLPEGTENLLNAQESIYYSFYARLYEAIGPIWQSLVRESMGRNRILPGDYTTIVEVVLDRDGNLAGVIQRKSSGIMEFDQAADKAWHQVGRFPNPPHGLLDGTGKVHTAWTFTVQMHEGFGLQYMPPERVY